MDARQPERGTLVGTGASDAFGPAGERLGPVYGIAVAAELTGVSAPMLRAYESKGLIVPFRTEGRTRRYSEQDLSTVNRITTLLAAGLNLSGIEHVLRLEDEARDLHATIDELQAERAAHRKTWGPQSEE